VNTATRPAVRRLCHQLGCALAVVPLLRWLIAVHTVPTDQPWRYHCPGCTTRLWPTACTPSGRCRRCGQRVGAPPYTVEILAVAAAGLLAWSTPAGWLLAAHTWWAAGMLALALVDAAALRLPHRITLVTTVGTVGLLAATGAAGSSWRGAILGAVALAGFYALVRVVSRGELGVGDVAVAIPIGLLLGWHDWRLTVAAALLGHTAAVAAIPVRRLTGHTARPIPLGTYLIAASFALVVFAGTTEATGGIP
jgi:leader peptidase (prepilin peptidase)/N-methyltransferase